MENSDLYGWLMTGSHHSACDRFDAHIVASTISLALAESTREGRSLSSAVGLEWPILTTFVTETFPHAQERLASLETTEPVVLAPDEACLRDLLLKCTTLGTPFQERLAAVVARRAQRPNHLWQDLGLRNRRELSWLMGRHFEWLASRNGQDMKWKKFLYRTICRDESFPICTAPSCAECCDFEGCFGDESGESLLAISRRAAERSIGR
ncbi:MAG: nitrogen fixation protein NifQ [Polyangiaceae bacterium]|jgi:nitrogen fixation protein NifQ